jgi:hypothetical protein
MTNGQNYSAMLKAAGLWAETSTKGGRYLTGRLGSVKVLIMENRNRKTDDDPSHHLVFVEAPDRRQGSPEHRKGPKMSLARRRLSQAQLSDVQGQAGRGDDVPPWER